METENKRRKYSTSSNDSDTTDSHVTSWSKSSRNTGTNSTWVRQEQKKLSEVFRTDFITAMKLPDSAQLSSDDFYVLSDPWRQEWEKGVQVPANIEAIPEPVVRVLPGVNWIPFYSPSPSQPFAEAGHTHSQPLDEPVSLYDLDDLDVCWLELVNAEFRELALPELDELTMERVLTKLESLCEENMQLTIETGEGLGIEYDEDVVCDVCRSPEGEDGNEMVFCDKCNVCVHQACYGILKVPLGTWLCRTCALGVQPKCLLCPRRGGALKPTRSGTKWVHVSCALWVPEVSIGCPEKMEPITKVSHIPPSRWALSCSLCRQHVGTCIQCSMPSCIVAFHVTCAFDHGLEMHTILAENDEVRFKSYCAEHSGRPQGDQPGPEQLPAPLEKASQRKQKLQELEDEFYRLVDPQDIAESLGLPGSHVDFLYQFWKLRRRSSFNRPLLAVKRDEVDNLAQQEQDILYRRLKLFTHLRQDLERVRNLCYMVTRRERMKRSLFDLQERILQLQIQLADDDLAGEKTLKRQKMRRNGVKERGKERQKSSPPKKERWKTERGKLLRGLGLSKPCPLDGALFNGWLAQSMQITTDNMLGQWSLDGEPQDRTASLLSDQLLQGEESLLILMKEPSVKPAWKVPQLGCQARAKPRGKGHKGRELGQAEARKAERSRAAPKAPPKHSFSPSHVAPEPTPQAPDSKMDSCHISDKWRPVAAASSREAAGATVRARPPRQGRSRAAGLELGGVSSPGPKDGSLLDPEMDGFFSDAELRSSDVHLGHSKLQFSQLHSGKTDVVQRSVLAS
ncbi:E3 ubiquitin-protein ligase Jade-2-like [Brienomyrus brachyistius]|uniref:E3 ubiquitin-protein ligase Jade-2-like n=1 Tax=Brienomyrus brachyistius TaxID=42636 RepID=UPI0020B399EB|nr:E3 ubiquitin-protein ligase Jade-2-like [Brienomyrus brachyistius]XP_048884290.1 E3 ubiquitin-protein ligase Jade-2-like [Brienomyrus brachyistius]XP_048884292.1 E3 ubiquitin-protein ligase Jade-2-like [Brienomyrus brachyistius]